jgi:multiple sugar transport system substrate-binding protein
MTELIAKHKLDLSQYEKTAVDGMRDPAKKEIHGLPVINVNRLLYFNKDLFNKFGVPFPTDGLSWEKANELGRQMTRMDSGIQYFGLASSKEHQIRMNALSVPLLDPVTQKSTIRSDERWRSIFEQGLFAPYQDSGYRAAIAKGLPSRSWFTKNQNLAMYVYLSFMPANEPESFDGLNWDMVSEPSYSQAPGISSQVYPTYFSIVSSSKKKDAALQAIQVLMSPEHQSYLARKGQMPVLNKEELKRELGQDTKFKDKNWKAVFHNKFAPIPYKSVLDVDLEKVYLNQHLDYALGKIDLNTLFRNAEEEANKLIESR